MILNPEVSELVAAIKHPLQDGINELRGFILSVNPELTENIKWNGPNYVYNDQDRITMRVQSPKLIQLIFHRGAKVQEALSDKLIQDDSNLLDWKSNDRAVITFKNSKEIESSKEALEEIITKWLDRA